MKVNEIVYYCLDAIKAFSDDSYVNEEHVLYLIGKYRVSLLQQYYNTKKPISESNYQTINVTLNKVLPVYKSKVYLESEECIPILMTITKPSVLLFNGFESEFIETVPFTRIKFVGHNKWKSNIIYASIDPNNKLHLISSNPQAYYLEQVKIKGIFEDFTKPYELLGVNDIMEEEFPMEFTLIPDLLIRVVKDVLGTAWRMADTKNDAADELANIATYIRQNMKKKYNNILEGEDEE